MTPTSGRDGHLFPVRLVMQAVRPYLQNGNCDNFARHRFIAIPKMSANASVALSSRLSVIYPPVDVDFYSQGSAIGTRILSISS